jgi:hypothetical protein
MPQKVAVCVRTIAHVTALYYFFISYKLLKLINKSTSKYELKGGVCTLPTN